MNYRVLVKIMNPKTKSVQDMELFAEFSHNPKTYGNGYYVYLSMENGWEHLYDLRYDMTFNPNNKSEWLKDWARAFWTGKNGAFELRSVEVVMI